MIHQTFGDPTTTGLSILAELINVIRARFEVLAGFRFHAVDVSFAEVGQLCLMLLQTRRDASRSGLHTGTKLLNVALTWSVSGTCRDGRGHDSDRDREHERSCNGEP
ncbi:MAG TPA: hypothetical protein VMW17_15240 [Candidatus Binatia bacterium]|nr:hypothetical protein [Candidatus Binatia bacterium]